MNCNETTEYLDELLHDRLPASVRLRVETHLAECGECRRGEHELRGLQASTSSLPRSIQPARDLWPGIERAIGAPSQRERGGTRAGTPRDALTPWAWNRWGLLAAAAMLLIVVSSGITALLLRPAEPPASTPSVRATASGVAWEQFQAAEAEYQRLSGELQQSLDARRDELSPETIRVVDENLRLIDEAIRESRVALERDPANAGLTTRITDIYRKRVSFLREMNRL